MPVYKMCYRINSSNVGNNQYEAVNAASQGEAKKLIEAKYKGSKINWVHIPQTGNPTWFKG